MHLFHLVKYAMFATALLNFRGHWYQYFTSLIELLISSCQGKFNVAIRKMNLLLVGCSQ